MGNSTIDKPTTASDAKRERFVYQHGQPKSAQSISRRFSYALIGVVTLFLVGSATIAILLNIARIDDELKARIDNAVNLSQISLPTSLWNLDNDVVDDFIGALFLDEAVVYAKVLWGDQVITERKSQGFEPKDLESTKAASGFEGAEFIVKSADIHFEGSKVGHILIVMSRKGVNRQILWQIYGIIALTIGIIVAISLTSILITRRYISRPLLKLQNSASLIADGDLDTFIDKSGRDEIGMLAQHLDAMRESIKRLFGELGESKNKLEDYSRTLEQRVEKRTRQLADANTGLTETLEQQTATSEVLRTISSSLTDAQPVFDMIAKNAKELCHGRICGVFQFDGELIHLVGHYGLTPEEADAYRGPWPAPPGRDSAIGRVILSRGIAHIPDVEADSEYSQRRMVQVVKFRSVLAVPMLHKGSPVGGIAVLRSVAELFPDKQVELLKTFANQAVIAIENVRLFQELTRSLEELKALGDVGQAISATLDLQTVLSTIVTHAVELTKTDAGTIYEFDEAEQVFIPQANYKLDEATVNAVRQSRMRVGDRSGMGRAAAARTAVQIPDLLNEPNYPMPFIQKAGFRALLCVPLLRENRIIGGLVLRRKAAGEFPPEILNLLQTFATHSGLAIQNARLFREIEDKGQQLELASQHKSEFLANMSHELRTPLNAIIGFSEVLLEKMFGQLNDKQEDYLNDIFTSGTHLLNLINDILDLSKIEAGKMELDMSTFDLRQLLSSSLVVVKERALAHEIALSLEMAEDIDIMADELKVKQIVFNLLSNAVKFTPDGGEVGIKTRRTDSVVEIAVWDNGIGIIPEDQERIFEEFHQAGETLTEKPEGTGLGLALTKRFVGLHGGRIWVESKQGHGSTLKFTLPIEGSTEPKRRA